MESMAIVTSSSCSRNAQSNSSNFNWNNANGFVLIQPCFNANVVHFCKRSICFMMPLLLRGWDFFSGGVLRR